MNTDEAQKQQARSGYPETTDASGTQVGVEQEVPHLQKQEVEGSSHQAHGEGSEQERIKWGTRVMGAPAAPSAHPQNQQAALWTAEEQHPSEAYVVKASPVQHSKSPMEAVLRSFNKWAKKAEDLAANVWMNLKTGQSVPDAAWGKLSLGAKALTEGGFEALFKQTFPVDPEEKLRKTYACYLSTSTGPVAGTLYISTMKIAFCSDRPLSFAAPSGEEAWSYYRVAIPLSKVKGVNPSSKQDNPAAKYIQIVTVDKHEFWFMGFVNYDKALSSLQESLTPFHSTHPASHQY
eukprot:Gb_22682 [translate_table: standard]